MLLLMALFRSFFFLATFFLVNLFICLFFWLCWVFVAAHGLSLVASSGGFSYCGARALGARASVVAEHKLSS